MTYKQLKQAIYHLKRGEVFFYRLGNSAKDARRRLALELKVDENEQT